MRLGTHSSSSNFIFGEQFYLEKFENSNHLIALHGREVVKKRLKIVSTFEIIKKVLYWNPRSPKNWGSAELFRINLNILIVNTHTTTSLGYPALPSNERSTSSQPTERILDL